MVLVPLAHEGEHHVVRVEVAARREGLGGLPLNALAQVEGIFQAVVGNLTRIVKGRLDVGGAGRELEQPVVDMARRGVEGGDGSGKLRIESLRSALRAEETGP